MISSLRPGNQPPANDHLTNDHSLDTNGSDSSVNTIDNSTDLVVLATTVFTSASTDLDTNSTLSTRYDNNDAALPPQPGTALYKRGILSDIPIFCMQLPGPSPLLLRAYFTKLQLFKQRVIIHGRVSICDQEQWVPIISSDVRIVNFGLIN